MIASPLCRSCGLSSDRVEWVVHDGQVVVANFWCSRCDEPGFVSASAFVDRRRDPLPSFATTSANNNHVHSSVSASMSNGDMERVVNGRHHVEEFRHHVEELR